MGVPNILHISPRAFLLKSFALGRRLFEAGIKPKHTISIWRGGTPVGLGVDSFYRVHGMALNHTTIATESYHGRHERSEVRVKGLEHVINVVCREDDLLILDDVYESGQTIQAIVKIIRERTRANCPKNIYVGTIHSKPSEHKYRELPIFALEEIEGSVWIDYPHELADLVHATDPSDPLIKQKDPVVWELLHTPALPPPTQLLTNPTPQRYLPPEELYYNAIRLGLHIARNEQFYPDFLIALWPGGVSAGLPIHEVFKYLKKKGEVPSIPDHISVNTTSTHLTYRSNIIGLEYLRDRIEKHHKLLIIEVAFRSGRLISDVVNRLKEQLRRNLTLDNIKVGTVYYDPQDDSTWTVRPFKEAPDFYWQKVNHNLIYPTNLHRLPHPYHDLPTLSPELFEIMYGS